MMSLETIAHLSSAAGIIARENGKIPLEVTPYMMRNWPPFPLPNLGDYIPPYWEEVRDEDGDLVQAFVDKTGMGSENEPAMTIKQFLAWLHEHCGKGIGFGIVEEGQFQIYVGKFRRTI